MMDERAEKEAKREEEREREPRRYGLEWMGAGGVCVHHACVCNQCTTAVVLEHIAVRFHGGTGSTHSLTGSMPPPPLSLARSHRLL